jgi:acyl-CoA reductase-like NAD-dependent aldehyde dehydrogenase
MSPSKVSNIKWDEFFNVVDGKNRSAKEKHYGIDPATGEQSFPVPIGNQQDVDDAVVSAQKAFEKWSQVPLAERKKMIEKFRDHYLSYADEMTALLEKESGKPVLSFSMLNYSIRTYLTYLTRT